MLLRTFSRIVVAAVFTQAAFADELVFTSAALAPQGVQETLLGVPAFDTRLGTLVRVEIDVETVIDASVHVENTGPVPAVAQTELHTRASLRVPGQAAPFVMTDSRNGFCGLQASDGTPDFAGPSSFVFDTRFALASHVVLTSNLAKFETHDAPTVVNLRANARSGASVVCSQPTISGTESSVSHRVRVTYVFARR